MTVVLTCGARFCQAHQCQEFLNTLRKLHLHVNKMKNTDENCQDHAVEALHGSIRKKAPLLL